jgi:hypothetical protein
MGLLSKLWKRSGEELPKYTLRLSVRGPTGDVRHQFLTFQAVSPAAAIQHAIQHAERRAQHEHVLRWKLLDEDNREIASAFARSIAVKYC